jgi:hypothetical protein
MVVNVVNKCVRAALFCTLATLAACDEQVGESPSDEASLDWDQLFESQRDADASANTAALTDLAVSQQPQAIQTTGLLYTLPARGGGGGGPGWLGCPSGYVAVGIYGRSGAYIDKLGLTCSRLDANGSLGPISDIGAYGGEGGGPFRRICPAGQAIVGFHGGSGAYVDRLGLYCSDVPNWMNSGAVQYTTAATGGEGGGPFADLCPHRYVVQQLNVRSGIYLDQIEPLCGYLEP